jgi:ubiquinone biosynthesis protein Coq4
MARGSSLGLEAGEQYGGAAMTIKYRQLVVAVYELLKDPFDFPPAVRLCDAVADTWVIRTLYQRMVADLPDEERSRLRELTRRPIDLDALRVLPPNTFGHCYAKFFEHRKLSPTAQVDAWPAIAQVFEKDWVMYRFPRVHDMHHLLLGFDIDAHGEMGLQMFNVRNFREPFGTLAMASFPWTAALYGDPLRMLREIERGYRLARHTKNLLTAPLEEYFERDIDDVRAELGIVTRAHRRQQAYASTNLGAQT